MQTALPNAKNVKFTKNLIGFDDIPHDGGEGAKNGNMFSVIFSQSELSVQQCQKNRKISSKVNKNARIRSKP